MLPSVPSLADYTAAVPGGSTPGAPAGIGTPVMLLVPPYSTATDSASFSDTTDAAVPTGARVFVAVVWSNDPARTLSTLAVGAVSLTADKVQTGLHSSGTYAYSFGLYSANAPSGIATASSAAIALSGTVNVIAMAAFYVTGLATVSVTDGTAASRFTTAGSTASAWTSGNVTTANAADILVGVSFADHSDNTITSVPGSSFTELTDTVDALAHLDLVVQYRIVSATGTYASTGNWQVGGTNSNPDYSDGSLLVAYKGA